MSMFLRLRIRRLFDLDVRAHPTWYGLTKEPRRGYCTASWTTVLFGSTKQDSLFQKGVDSCYTNGKRL